MGQRSVLLSSISHPFMNHDRKDTHVFILSNFSTDVQGCNNYYWGPKMVSMLAVKWSNASFPSLQGKLLFVCVCFWFCFSLNKFIKEMCRNWRNRSMYLLFSLIEYEQIRSSYVGERLFYKNGKNKNNNLSNWFEDVFHSQLVNKSVKLFLWKTFNQHIGNLV